MFRFSLRGGMRGFLVPFIGLPTWLAVVSIAADCKCHAQRNEPPWSPPSLTAAVVVVDPGTRQHVQFDDFMAQLAEADVVFLGEQHTDETTHRLQLDVIERLLKLKQNRVVLALEMFDRDVQPSLDGYLSGELSEEKFLAAARPWANYREAYRPLVEAAKRAGVPVVASNFPAPIRQRLAMSGADDLSPLTPEDRKVTPRKYLGNTLAYWKRVDNAVRGHMGMTPKNPSDQERLYSTQSLWDNSMGEACADAIAAHPGYTVVHVNGGFHSSNWEGAVHQLRQRQPKCKIVTVAIAPTSNPATQPVVGVPSADFLAFVESVATNLDEGKRTVRIGRELSYQLHLPEGASPEHPVPLLIWLNDDGLTAEEGMQFCRQRFGDLTAIVVVEPPYKEMQLDLAVGGRWFWSDAFSEDSGVLVHGVGEIWAYVMRHFPIDPKRVCLAGEGTGATMAAAIALHTDKLSAHTVALAPRQFAKLKDLPLPLPEDFEKGELPARSLVVAGAKGLNNWWADELAAYSNVQMPSRFAADAGDSWDVERQRLNLIRAALGVEPVAAPSGDQIKAIVIAEQSPRALHWGRLQSHWLSQKTGAPVTVVDRPTGDQQDRILSTEVSPQNIAQPGVAPPCPGPFGGTTILVAPPDATPQAIEEWVALEKNDPLAKKSRFHRMRVATEQGERSIVKVLAKLQSENRRNVLIVPAVFYASPAWLQTLRSAVREFEDDMTLQWMPGLGGRKGALTTDQAMQ